MTVYRPLTWNKYATHLYNFWEGDGSYIVDDAGTKNGNLNNVTWGAQNGLPVGVFSGSSSYCTFSLLSTATTNFTLEALFYTGTLPTSTTDSVQQTVVYNGNTTGGSSNGFGIALHYVSGSVYVAARLGGVGWVTASDLGALSANTWYYVAITRDTSTLRVYVNGSLSSTTETSSIITPTTTTHIGDSYGGSTQPFNGKIASVRLSATKYSDSFIAGEWTKVTTAYDPAPTSTDDVLRVYGNLDGTGAYTDLTTATAGGFSKLTKTDVRNAAGSLAFTLTATTPAMFNAVLSEGAKVEYWRNQARVQSYWIDDYSVKYSDLSCQVNCSGPLVTCDNEITLAITAGDDFSDTMQRIVNAAAVEHKFVHSTALNPPDLRYFADLPAMTLSGKAADVMRELAQMVDWSFYVDSAGILQVTLNPPSTAGVRSVAADVAYDIGASTSTASDFETTYSARDIINALTVEYVDGSKGTERNDTTSQATYGVRRGGVKVASPPLTSAYDAALADALLARLAYPQLSAGLTVGHTTTVRPGLLAQVTGLADGRDYRQLIEQVTWSYDDINHDELYLGAAPLALT